MTVYAGWQFLPVSKKIFHTREHSDFNGAKRAVALVVAVLLAGWLLERVSVVVPI